MSVSTVRSATQPSVNHIYTRPGYTGPFPQFTETDGGWEGELISGDGSKPILRLSTELVLKFGAHVNANEAESLLFVEKHAPSIPAPRVYAFYTIGPYDRDPDDYGCVYDTFIIMSFVDGVRLDQVWATLDEAQKARIGAQLCSHVGELRSVPPAAQMRFCSVMGGALQDCIFGGHTTQGPFRNEHDLNNALATIQDESNRKAHLRFLTAGALAQCQHKASLTHGDLQGRNILVTQDKVTGIVDWEWCGWYPEYWEFARCFRVGGWPKDWPSFVSSIMQPYFLEWTVLEAISRHVW